MARARKRGGKKERSSKGGESEHESTEGREKERDADLEELKSAFRWGKRARAQRRIEEAEQQAAQKREKKRKERREQLLDQQQLRHKGVTAEGYSIYSWNDLASGAGQLAPNSKPAKAGTTSDCPFDCWCCFC
jgi:FKBP-type peptidyl-prolyl cis-trans isomerase